MYSFQWPRSFASAEENFQFFSGSSMRSRKRRFCSARDRFRKNLRISTPLRDRYRSKPRMSW